MTSCRTRGYTDADAETGVFVEEEGARGGGRAEGEGGEGEGLREAYQPARGKHFLLQILFFYRVFSQVNLPAACPISHSVRVTHQPECWPKSQTMQRNMGSQCTHARTRTLRSVNECQPMC
eukprot:3436837-Rhodomonas_salina.1